MSMLDRRCVSIKGKQRTHRATRMMGFDRSPKRRGRTAADTLNDVLDDCKLAPRGRVALEALHRYDCSSASCNVTCHGRPRHLGLKQNMTRLVPEIGNKFDRRLRNPY